MSITNFLYDNRMKFISIYQNWNKGSFLPTSLQIHQPRDVLILCEWESNFKFSAM